MSCPNASLGGDEWGQSYYSFELLRCGGKAADIQSSMTFGVCYFFFTFFNSWARDLWFDKCLKLFFFPNGHHLNTPHRQTSLFLSLSFSLAVFESWSVFYPFNGDFYKLFALQWTWPMGFIAFKLCITRVEHFSFPNPLKSAHTVSWHSRIWDRKRYYYVECGESSTWPMCTDKFNSNTYCTVQWENHFGADTLTS